MMLLARGSFQLSPAGRAGGSDTVILSPAFQDEIALQLVGDFGPQEAERNFRDSSSAKEWRPQNDTPPEVTVYSRDMSISGRNLAPTFHPFLASMNQ
jgi:hypothetical protein